jgi:hypothetical protein
LPSISPETDLPACPFSVPWMITGSPKSTGFSDHRVLPVPLACRRHRPAGHLRRDALHSSP